MEKIVEQGLLYDFYGELLTDHQRSVYEDVVFNDLSPSEIAKEQGISRQGVRETVGEIERQADEYMDTRDLERIEQIRRLSGEITNTL